MSDKYAVILQASILKVGTVLSEYKSDANSYFYLYEYSMESIM